LYSFDQFHRDVVQLLKEKSGEADFKEKKSGEKIELRFVPRGESGHRFEIELVPTPHFHEFWFIAFTTSDAPLWHRGDDRVSFDEASGKEKTVFLVNEACSILSRPSRIIMKKGIIFTTATLLSQTDGKWRAVRLPKMVTFSRDRFRGLGRKETYAHAAIKGR